MMRGAIWIAAALVSAAPGPAAACVNGVELEVHENVSNTSRAERLVRDGHLRRGFRLAGRTLREVARATSAEGRAQRERLKRVLAIATVRLGGRVDRRRWRTPSEVSASARDENLRWALEVLAQMARRSDDPVVRTRHAEAFAALRRWRAAADILQPLAERDLMPDAYGYATLARAQHELGDADEASRAIRACRAVASYAERGICRDPGRS